MAFSKEKAHERAERFAAKGQHDRAAREYQSIVDHDPKDVRAWLMLADCLVRSGDQLGAVGRYLQVADFYAQAKQPQKALAVYRQVLNLDPHRLDVHFKCASLNLELGRIHDAIASYEQVAHAQMGAGQVTEAINTFQVIADADPTVVSKRLRLAELYSRERMVAEAVEAFRQAGDQLLVAGRHADYVRVAERLIYHQNDDQPTIRQLARVYLQLGDPRRALMKLNALLHADQDDNEGLELLAETFVALGKPDKAVSVVIELVRTLRGKSGASVTDEALRVLRRGLEWDSRSGELLRLQAELAGNAPASAQLPARGRPDTMPPPRAEEPPANVAEAYQPPVDDDVEEIDDDDVLELDDEDVIMSESDAVELPPGGPPHSITDSVIDEVSSVEPVIGIEGAPDFDKILFEARVYVKYRLFEHALDHVQELLDQQQDHVGALSLRARALTELSRDEEAAETHVRVAQLVHSRDPKLAREHLSAALASAPNHLGAAALQSDLGISLDQAEPAPDLGVPQVGIPLGDSAAFELDDEDEFAIEVADGDEEVATTQPVEVEDRFGVSASTPLPEDGPGARSENTPPAGFVPRPPSDPAAPDIASRQSSSPLGRDATMLVIDAEITDQPTDQFSVEDAAPDPAEDMETPPAPDDYGDGIDALLNRGAPIRGPSPTSGVPDILTDPDSGVIDEELEPSAEVLSDSQVSARPTAPPEPPDLSDDLAEIRFYLDQGLDDDAGAALDDLEARHPRHHQIEALRQSMKADLVAPPRTTEMSGAQPLIDLSAEEDEEADAYLSAIFSEAPEKKKKPVEIQARADLEEADARTFFDLGMAYREMGLIDDAIKQFDRASADPEWQSRALVMSATLKVHRGQPEDAVDDLRKAIDAAQNDDERCEASYELGILFEKIGDTDSAIRQLQAVTAGFRDRDELLSELLG